ncbi:hypothetical protein GCM10027445_26090 [Amycolatopsis endophytica]|uniref:ABC-type glycerol-3-phosphate transport system substrate-binding protein n=1 Tax=Amycolatopsis endophytica TaxID=860233 RepID=A0A853BC98_9PSEU|nr:extracellular solute-binding protein [Amycolatopsis endophytica]NYI92297.1 ABC-type glycerol-3-phosphate transport system substrate-binding protein [Amycolatopsis endophytica]
MSSRSTETTPSRRPRAFGRRELMKKGLTGAAALGALSMAGACDSMYTSGSNGRAKIRVWTWYTQQRDEWPRLVDEFQQAHPTIEVENRLFGNTNAYLPALQAAVSAGDPPDVFGPHVLAVTYGQAGISADLRKELGADFLADFVQSTNDAYSDGDKQYAVGWMAQMFGIFYDPEVFRRASVDVPETWDDLIEAVRRIRTATRLEGCVVRNIPGTAGLDFLLPLVTQITGDPKLMIDIDHQRGGAKWTHPAVVEAMRHVRGMIEGGTISPGPNGIAQPQDERLLYAGEAAMLYSGSWIPQDFAQSAPPEFVRRYRVMKTPAWAAGQRHWTANQAGAGLAVSDVSRNKEAALEFLRFIYQRDRYARTMNDSRSMPSTKSAGQLVQDPVMREMTQWLLDGDGAPHILFGKGSSAAASNAFAGVVGGQLSPESAAETIQSRVEAAARR